MPSYRGMTFLRRRSLLRPATVLVGVGALSVAFAIGVYPGLGRETRTHSVGDNLVVSPGAVPGEVLKAGAHPSPRRHDSRADRHPRKQVKPIPRPASASTSSCSGASNAPGGRDPWGGCWPGPDNTGVLAGTVLMPYTGKVLSNGACMITTNTVIVGKTLSCQIIVISGNLTLEDSSVTGEVYNHGSGSVLIKNSTINGGSDHTETVLGSHLTIEGSDLYGNQHEVYCGSNCTVENSWLHDTHNFGRAGHEDGFLSTGGGDDYNLQHNSVDCVGLCTGDITFLGSVSDAIVNKNLFVAPHVAAFCLYPSSPSPSIVNQMTITNNVFQRGSSGKCAYYGPTYGWNMPNNNPGTSGYRNVWSGNVWDDGKVLEAGRSG